MMHLPSPSTSSPPFYSRCPRNHLHLSIGTFPVSFALVKVLPLIWSLIPVCLELNFSYFFAPLSVLVFLSAGSFFLVRAGISLIFFSGQHSCIVKWVLCKRFFNFVDAEPWIEARLLFVVFSWIFGEFDGNLGELFFFKIFPIEFFCIVLQDLDGFEADDHGESGNSLMNGVGDFQREVETVEGACKIEILVSLLAE